MSGEENGAVRTAEDYEAQKARSMAFVTETSAPAQPPRDRAQDAAKVLSVAMRVLAERAFPWVTLMLSAILWFCVTLLVDATPMRLVAATVFSVLTHVPTWGCWRKGS